MAINLIYIVFGTAAGVLAGLFGIGGGLIMVIGMVTLMKLPFKVATGTSLAAMLLPVGLFGVLEYHKNGNLYLRAAAFLAAGLALGTWLGARWAQDLAPGVLQRMFALFLVFVAVRMWVTA